MNIGVVLKEDFHVVDGKPVANKPALTMPTVADYESVIERYQKIADISSRKAEQCSNSRNKLIKEITTGIYRLYSLEAEVRSDGSEDAANAYKALYSDLKVKVERANNLEKTIKGRRNDEKHAKKVVKDLREKMLALKRFQEQQQPEVENGNQA